MMATRHALLVVDDEEANLQKLRRTFVRDFTVYPASGGEEALEIVRRHPISAIITDQRMPGMSGVELLRKSLEINPETVRMILTGYTEVEDLMDAINQGHVHGYITKPWEPFALRQSVQQELKRLDLERENARLSKELKLANERLERENFKLKQEMESLQDRKTELIYKSRAMADLLQMMDRVVQTDSTVLIQGETGTGKELLARYVHRNSPRHAEAFIPVNCGAIPADLVESAFFGHRKGAFTGATETTKGFFELADQGTLFLDEIGEAPLDLQVKLLRVLQDGRVLVVGSPTHKRINVRVIVSTNRNLAQRVDEGAFRQDLFFRLNVFSVHVPPLRARPEDIPVLAEFFLERSGRRLNKIVSGFEPQTLYHLRRYAWPGNVRELENEIERVVILADSGQAIPPSLLSERVRSENALPHSQGTLKTQLRELERQLILDALETHHNNKSQTAEALGITRQTIIAKLKQYQQ
ncbi:MAG: sigma-54-dependent transcriptional regulator [Acidobacteriota bacterium]